ncbi:MAG: ABC transporter substrate-binding protein [Anaerolineales bacterium]|nr:ABC transporter substrate-binding protein [Anaerolineales bacterium]
MSPRRSILKALSLCALTLLTACGPAAAPAATTGSDGATPLRVGYFPNLTHSQALIGLARGDFREALGNDVSIEATSFNAGPAVIEALFAGAIDLAYIGPNPAINGYVKSRGEALRIVAGATSGGAAFVVRPEAGINGPDDLAGKKLATPQLGGTQDVALRNYIVTHGLKTVENGGDVEIVPTDNSQTLDLFRQGMIDGAWVPEPWASRLVVEGGGAIFIDERDLWPNGDFVTTHIIVSTAFLEAHPDIIRNWLRAHVAITQWELEHPDEAKAAVNAEIERITGRKLPDAVLEQAWTRLRVTWDPIAPSLTTAAESAFTAGFLNEKPDLTGIYDLTLLNEVLVEAGQPALAP